MDKPARTVYFYKSMNQLGLFTFMNMNLFAGEIYRLQNNFPVMVIKF